MLPSHCLRRRPCRRDHRRFSSAVPLVSAGELSSVAIAGADCNVGITPSRTADTPSNIRVRRESTGLVWLVGTSIVSRCLQNALSCGFCPALIAVGPGTVRVGHDLVPFGKFRETSSKEVGPFHSKARKRITKFRKYGIPKKSGRASGGRCPSYAVFRVFVLSQFRD